MRRPKTHIKHPVFADVTLCGLETDVETGHPLGVNLPPAHDQRKNGASAVYVGRAYDCAACRNVLGHYAAMYTPHLRAIP